MKNLTKSNSSSDIRSVTIDEFSDPYGSVVTLVRDFYSETSYDYKVVRYSFSDCLESFTYDTYSDAVAKFIYLVTSLLVI